MKTVADTLEVSGSNLAERLKGKSKPRDPYRKADDAELLPAIQIVINARSTYGYQPHHGVWRGPPSRLHYRCFGRGIIAWAAVANAGICARHDARGCRATPWYDPSAACHRTSGNGSLYTALETWLFAQALNLTPCFTPVASHSPMACPKRSSKLVRISPFRAPKGPPADR